MAKYWHNQQKLTFQTRFKDSSLMNYIALCNTESFPMDQVAWGEVEIDQRWNIYRNEKRVLGQPVYLTEWRHVAGNRSPVISDKALVVTDRAIHTEICSISCILTPAPLLAGFQTVMVAPSLQNGTRLAPSFQRWRGQQTNRDTVKLNMYRWNGCNNADALTCRHLRSGEAMVKALPDGCNGFAQWISLIAYWMTVEITTPRVKRSR